MIQSSNFSNIFGREKRKSNIGTKKVSKKFQQQLNDKNFLDFEDLL